MSGNRTRCLTPVLCAGLSAALIAALAPGAAAQVLTEGARDRLCVNDQVDLGRLAFALVNEARAAPFAATSIDNTPDDLKAAEALEALRFLVTEADDEPGFIFGTGVLSTAPEARAARERLLAVVTTAILPLGAAPEVAGSVTYRLVPGPATTAVYPPDIFTGSSGHVIVCEPTPQAGSGGAQAAGTGGTGGAAAEDESDGAPSRGWRLRGAVDDLTNEDKLSELDPATIGLAVDEEAGSETVTLDAVFGYRFPRAFGRWDVIPFISYELKSVSPGDDTEVVSPGVLFGHFLDRPDFALDTRVELSWVNDREQSSEQVKTRAYFDPAFRIGPGRLLFGNWLNTRPLNIRPDLTLIGDYSDVRDPGSNPELVNGSYLGWGGDLSVRIRNDAWDHLTLTVGRRQLWLSGDIVIDEAARWYGSLDYSFDDSPVGVAVKWSDGRKDDTFQDEDTISLELTLRH